MAGIGLPALILFVNWSFSFAVCSLQFCRFPVLQPFQPHRPDRSFREDVTKLQKGDFFASKLIVFSVTFGRKTKESQPPTGAARHFLPRSLLRTSRAAKWRNPSSIYRASQAVFELENLCNIAHRSA